jgi:predicted ATPase
MANHTSHRRGPYLLSLSLMRPWIRDEREFPFQLPAIKRLNTLEFHPQVTFFVGENGSGKSTLLEAVAIKLGLNPEGGSRNINFATRETHSQLHYVLRLALTPGTLPDAYFLRAESFYNVATEIDKLDEDDPESTYRRPRKIIDQYGGQSLHMQSHGESFFALFQHRFNNEGIYLLDEPEAALSPARQLAFLALIHEYVQGGAQFVIATHSPILMAYPQARILHFGPEGIRAQAYKETEHYRVTRGFLESPERSFRELFGE